MTLTLQRCFLADKLSLVPRLTSKSRSSCAHVVLLFWLKGGPWSIEAEAAESTSRRSLSDPEPTIDLQEAEVQILREVRMVRTRSLCPRRAPIERLR